MPERRLSSIEISEQIAAKTGLSVEQVKSVLTAQAEMALANVSAGFRIPGIGILTKVDRPERKMVMRFGPDIGKEKVIPASKKLDFRISRIARTMVFGKQQQPMPNLFEPDATRDWRFSTEAQKLQDPSPFLGVLGAGATISQSGKPASLIVHQLPDLSIPSGRIIAMDPMIGGSEPFARQLEPGRYGLALAIAQLGSDQRVAFAMLRLSTKRVSRWEPATTVQQPESSTSSRRTGYGVDSGTGAFADSAAAELMAEAQDSDEDLFNRIISEMKASYQSTRQWVHIETSAGSIVAFSSGYGDGVYASYFGLDEQGNPAMLVTDFGIVKWAATPAE